MTTLAGALIALVSLLGTSWYTITGPYVVDDPAHITTDAPVVLLVDPHLGSHHSWLVWTVFGCCLVAAALAGVPKASLSLAARIVAPGLALLLIALAVARVAIAGFAVGTGTGLPPHTRVELHFGFWLALVGFALIGAGAALGPASAAPRPQAGFSVRSPDQSTW